MKIGNLDISNIKLGSLQVKKILSGITLVWSYIQMLIDNFKSRVFNGQGQFEAEACLEAQLNTLNDENVLDNASLVITPNSYKSDVLYSVVPSDGSGDMDFVRATTGTRVNVDGFIETVPYNLYSYSEDFTLGWINSSISFSDTIELSPNGITNAQLCTCIGSETAQRRRNVIGLINVTEGDQFVMSCYFKKKDFEWVQLNPVYSPNFNGNDWANFNLTTGTIGNTGTGAVASIEDVGDGWFLCSLVVNVDITASTYMGMFIDTANTDSGRYPRLLLTEDVEAYYMWGAQLTPGTEIKDYYPTTDKLNIPRIDYSNGTCPSILVEPQRTNLCLQSNTFTTSWVTVGTITSNIYISPDGGLNASRLETIGVSSLYQNINLILNNVYTISVWVKANSETNNVFRLYGSNSFISENFTATTEWQRFSFTFTANATSLRTNGITRPTTAANMDLQIYGFQLELGENVTSYIPTTTASVTRNADSIINVNLSSYIGQTEGTVLVKGAQFNRGIVFRVRNNTNTSVNRLTIFCTGTNGRVEVGVMKDNANISTAPVIPVNGVNEKNIIMVYSQNVFKVFISGQLIYEYNYPTPTDFTAVMNTVEFGSLSEKGTATFDLITLWKTVLTDEQAINLTTL